MTLSENRDWSERRSPSPVIREVPGTFGPIQIVHGLCYCGESGVQRVHNGLASGIHCDECLVPITERAPS